MKGLIVLFLFSFFWPYGPPVSTVPWEDRSVPSLLQDRSVPPPAGQVRIPPCGTGPYSTGGVHNPPLRDRSVPSPPTGPYPPRDSEWHVTNICAGITLYRKYPKYSEGPRIFETRNRMSVATPALPCDGHVETKSDAGCEWSRQIKASVCNWRASLWIPNQNKCELGWESFRDRCIGTWAPSRLSR